MDIVEGVWGESLHSETSLVFSVCCSVGSIHLIPIQAKGIRQRNVLRAFRISLNEPLTYTMNKTMANAKCFSYDISGPNLWNQLLSASKRPFKSVSLFMRSSPMTPLQYSN